MLKSSNKCSVISKSKKASTKLHNEVVGGGAGVLPPESLQPRPLLLHLCSSAWICQPLWNQFLHWRFRFGYIFQFVYTHYQEIARGRSNRGTCNIIPQNYFMSQCFGFKWKTSEIWGNETFKMVVVTSKHGQWQIMNSNLLISK